MLTVGCLEPYTWDFSIFVNIFFFRFPEHAIQRSYSLKTLLLQIAAKRFQTFPENGPHKTMLGVLKFEFSDSLPILFFENVKFTIVFYGESKTSIIWKTSDRRAERSEIWESRAVV